MGLRDFAVRAAASGSIRPRDRGGRRMHFGSTSPAPPPAVDPDLVVAVDRLYRRQAGMTTLAYRSGLAVHRGELTGLCRFDGSPLNDDDSRPLEPGEAPVTDATIELANSKAMASWLDAAKKRDRDGPQFESVLDQFMYEDGWIDGHGRPTRPTGGEVPVREYKTGMPPERYR